jgi:hypothetical protein
MREATLRKAITEPLAAEPFSKIGYPAKKHARQDFSTSRVAVTSLTLLHSGRVAPATRTTARQYHSDDLLS